MPLKESEILELKKSTAELKEAIISICAILNKHQSGLLYFGLKNDGTVVGQDVSEKIIRDISKSIADHIEPKIYPEVKTVILDGKSCVEIHFSGKSGPYFAFGRAYIRVGDEDRQLSADEVERFILKKNFETVRWESQPSTQTIEDLDVRVIKHFVQKANQAGRIKFKFASVEATLKKLGLIQNGKLLRAGEVLFCSSSPLKIQAAVFAGVDKLTFLDIRQFEGNLFSLLAEAESYLKEKMNWRVKFGKLEREEIPEIPIEALREALVNSVCHRDYISPESNYIAIYKDRIEIENPGAFPSGFEPEDFIYKSERSILRNPLIADVLYRTRDIEKWGSGLKRIHDECAEQGVKVEFQKMKAGFKVVFHRLPQPEAATPETTRKTGKKPRVKTREKIIELIRQTPTITTQELAAETELTVKGVEWNLRQLKQKRILKRIGPDKGGRWEIEKPQE
jgi:ATP-dependent DNA helicase RecG